MHFSERIQVVLRRISVPVWFYEDKGVMYNGAGTSDSRHYDSNPISLCT